MLSSYDVVVLGGGAAGLMCAIQAGKRGRRVLVLERSEKVGKKILISGGGRCNFTNLLADPTRYLTSNPHFPISALRRYTSTDFIDLVERHGIAYHEKKLGQLFCDGSARQVVDLLLQECRGVNVHIQPSCVIKSVAKSRLFSIVTSLGTVSSAALVVATGGLSIPKMGATGFAYEIATQFGLGVCETRPGLVPLTFKPPTLNLFNSLAGVSVDISASCEGSVWRENMLFTHRGISGPAILQASSFWREGRVVEIDLLPDLDDALEHLAAERERRPHTQLASVLGSLMPKRLAQALCGEDGTRPMRSLSNEWLKEFANGLKRWVVRPDGTEGYRVAEVTMGGIDTDGLSSQTMEARSVPGLYFVGEAVDVTGPLGGYNFQWAWSSGYCAGQAA